MDEDTSNRIFWTIIKWTLSLIATFGILATIFWLLFYSVNLANLSFIIPLRNWYQDTYWKVEGLLFKPRRIYPPFAPLFTIQVSGQANNGYSYVFWGTFLAFDANDKTITLTGFDQRTYVFGRGLGLTDNLLDFPVLQSKNGNLFASNNQAQIAPINLSDNLKEANIGVFQIRWLDKRDFPQLMNDYSRNPKVPLNRDSQGSTIILLYN